MSGNGHNGFLIPSVPDIETVMNSTAKFPNDIFTNEADISTISSIASKFYSF